MLAILAMGIASTGQASTILISDDFSGSSADPLLGTAPDTYTVPGGDGVWESPSAALADSFKADGSVTAGEQFDRIFLDFAPVQGNSYTLSATLTPTAGGVFNALEFGFASADTERIPRPIGRGYVMYDFTGRLEYSPGNNSESVQVGNFFDDGTAVTFAFTLDASDASATNWTMGLTANGSEIFAPTIAAADLSEISFVGFSLNGTPSGSYDNLQLVVIPEPGTYALLAGCFSLSCLMLRRRRA